MQQPYATVTFVWFLIARKMGSFCPDLRIHHQHTTTNCARMWVVLFRRYITAAFRRDAAKAWKQFMLQNLGINKKTVYLTIIQELFCISAVAVLIFNLKLLHKCTQVLTGKDSSYVHCACNSIHKIWDRKNLCSSYRFFVFAFSLRHFDYLR